jgi:hypothetical protein
MICRLWRGWTSPENAAAYQALLKHEIMPGIRAKDIAGLLAHQALRRDIIGADGTPETEHMTLIWFETLEDVQGFVGQDYTIANMPAAAQAVLKRWDKRVLHFDVFDDPDSMTGEIPTS